MAGWQEWQESWDRQQEWYLPDREERFRAMIDAVEALVGPAPRVLDLACGTGTISARVLRRLPGAECTGVDLDPALLTIARGYFGETGDLERGRVRFVTADLRDEDWSAALPHQTYDAVLSSTALHWLREEPLRALYGRLARIIRPGGVFVNADHTPNAATPLINEAERVYRKARQERAREEGALDWVDWWRSAAADPALAEAVARRYEIFGDPLDGDHEDGTAWSAAWHGEALRAAGFTETTVAWASLTDSAVLALR